MQRHSLFSTASFVHTFFLATILTFCSCAVAQKSPIKTPSPLPSDVTPKVFEGECGDFLGHYGPMDFRSAHPDDRRIVERYHFDNEYAAFLRGKTTANTIGSSGLAVGSGFQYTLKSFPNHPTALYAMEQLGIRLKSERLPGTQYPLECWFVRAFKITPDDPVVRAMYGIYLANRRRTKEAIHNLEIADQALSDDPNMQYNIGLMNFKLGRFDQAQINSMRAEKLGFRLDGLEKLLKRSGHWNPTTTLPVEKTDVTATTDPSDKE